MGFDLGLSSPRCGALYYLEPGVPADEEEASWRRLESGDEGLDSGDDVDPDVGPTAIFTDPEIAAIGLTERAARDAGHDVVVGTGAFRGGKARAWGEERGLVKVILSTDGRILGAHIAAYHAADLLHPIVVAMQSGDQARQVMRASQHIHPTLGEVVKSAIDTAT